MKTPQTSRQYFTWGFKGEPQLCTTYAERRKTLERPVKKYSSLDIWKSIAFVDRKVGT